VRHLKNVVRHLKIAVGGARNVDLTAMKIAKSVDLTAMKITKSVDLTAAKSIIVHTSTIKISPTTLLHLEHHLEGIAGRISSQMMNSRE
jgi:hypothetical protein